MPPPRNPSQQQSAERKVALGFALVWSADVRDRLAAIAPEDLLRARVLWWAEAPYPLNRLLEAE